MHRIHTEQLDKSEKSRLWDEIAQDFLQSGIKLKEYSHHNGLNYDHLAYYLQRHRKQKTQTAKQPIEFIPVQITSSITNSQYSIKIDNIEVLLPTSCGITQIAALVNELRSKSC